MKKIYCAISRFLSKYYVLNILVLSLITLIIGALIFFEPMHSLEPIAFVCSIYGGMRLITYKNGKIPFFMIDHTWDKMCVEHGEEKAEELYREMSLKHATVCYMIAVPTSVLAIIWEALYTVIFT